MIFKRELKVNLKSFIIWNVILLIFFGVVYIMYPSITNNMNVDEINNLMASFPKEMLKAFNFDLVSVSTAFGWIKSEGFTFAFLIIGCYASILGSNILLKEENDKTVEYLNALPIKRNNIVFEKILCSLIYIVLTILLFGLFNYICLSLSGDFDHKQLILMSITPLFSSLVFYSLCLFLSTFFHKTKKMLGLSLGIVFISYMLQMISCMDKSVEFLKYFSIYTLSDFRNVLTDLSINPYMIVITILLTTILIILTVVRYNKKELV